MKRHKGNGARLICLGCHGASDCQQAHLISCRGVCNVCMKNSTVVECNARIDEEKMKRLRADADATTGEFREKPWTKDVPRKPSCRCGECNRLIKIYQRKLNHSMSKGLIKMNKLHTLRPNAKGFHITQIFRDRGDFAKLRFWGLIEEVISSKPKRKKTCGVWKITELGKRFVSCELKVPLYATVRYGSEHIGFAGPMVDIRRSLGKRFDYEELMSDEYWTEDRALKSV